jgi:two-component system chemotaxis response regulator CheY
MTDDGVRGDGASIAMLENAGGAMKRLLIVDDAMLMRKMIRDVAVAAGWEVAGEARNGAEAVALYQRLRPDLVTMDVVMPELGGLDALRQIRAADPAAQVVMITALDQKQTLMESIRAGAIDFIVKPFERGRILGLLSKVAVQSEPRTAVPERPSQTHEAVRENT